MAKMMRKNFDILMTFNKMQDSIRQGEHWVRSDWKHDKYVMLADERYCTPCLLLVYKDTNQYIIFHPTYKDRALKWRRTDGKDN